LLERVCRKCDGETSVAGIAAALGEDERAVWLALHQLTKAQLLTEVPFPPYMSAAILPAHRESPPIGFTLLASERRIGHVL
jgi:hypothetical protein